MVPLRPPEDARAIVWDADLATIRCPLSGLVAFAQDPRPLTPRQRESIGVDRLREDWQRTLAWTLEQFGASATFTPKQPKLVADLLHAGLCQVRDKRRGGATVPEVRVRIEERAGHGRGFGGSGGRVFSFPDGLPFLRVRDWIS